MLQNVCINRFSKEKHDQLLEANLSSTARDQGNGKQKTERGMHIICPTWNTVLGRPVTGVTHMWLLCIVLVSQAQGNAHAAFGLRQ